MMTVALTNQHRRFLCGSGYFTRTRKARNLGYQEKWSASDILELGFTEIPTYCRSFRIEPKINEQKTDFVFISFFRNSIYSSAQATILDLVNTNLTFFNTCTSILHILSHLVCTTIIMFKLQNFHRCTLYGGVQIWEIRMKA